MNSLSSFPITSRSTKMVLESLLAQGVRCTVIPDTNIFLVSKGGKEHLIIDGYLPLIPYDLGLVISNKFFCKQVLLANKLSTPPGKSFLPQEKRQAMRYMEELGFPVVLKIEDSQFNFPSLLVPTSMEAEKQWAQGAMVGKGIIVEQCVQGLTLDIVIFNNGYLSILEKSTTFKISPYEKRVSHTSPVPVWRDVTVQYRQKIAPIAKKALRSFGGPPLLRLTLKIHDQSPFTYSILEIYHAVSQHVEFMAHKKKDSLSVTSLVCTYMFPSL